LRKGPVKIFKTWKPKVLNGQKHVPEGSEEDQSGMGGGLFRVPPFKQEALAKRVSHPIQGVVLVGDKKHKKRDAQDCQLSNGKILPIPLLNETMEEDRPCLSRGRLRKKE